MENTNQTNMTSSKSFLRRKISFLLVISVLLMFALSVSSVFAVPTVVLNTPINSTNISNEAFTLNATIAGVEGVNITTTPWFSVSNSTNTWNYSTTNISSEYINVTFNTSALSADGAYNITVFAYNTTDGLNNSIIHVFTVDNTAPNFTYNVSNNTAYGSVIYIAANFTDGTTGIKNASLFVNGVQNTTNLTVSGAADALTTVNFTFTPTAAQVSSTLNFSIKVWDFAGNFNESQNMSITITDATPPNASLNTPTASFNVSGVYTLNATVNDSIAVNAVWFAISNMSSGWYKWNYTTTNVSSDYINVTFNASVLTAAEGDGNYNITIFTNDSTNNTNNSIVRVFTVDTTAPNYTYNVSNNTASGSAIYIAANFTDGTTGVKNASLFVNGVQNATNTTVSGSANALTTVNFSYTPLANLVATTLNFSIKVWDYAGNFNESQNMSVTITDGTSPNVTLNKPSNSSNITGVYTLNATIRDDVAISSAKFSISNMSKGWYKWNYTVNNISDFYINTTFNASVISASDGDGNYNVTIFSNDTTGNANNTIVKVFTIDTAGPALNWNNTNNTNYGAAIYIAANFTDATTGIKNASLYVNGALNSSNTTFPGGPNTLRIANFTFTPGLTQVGDSINFTVVAYDFAGNSNTTPNLSITITDNINPNVSIVTPTNESNISGVYVFNASVLDAVAVTSVWFAITNASATAYNKNHTASNVSSYYYASINTSNTSIFPVSGGTYNVTIFANDTTGNLNSSIKVQFVVDNYAPIFNFTLSDRYVKSTDLVVITVNATDNISGISTVIAEGVALNQSANIWNGTILLSSEEVLNITVVDTANNTNTSSITSPGITYALDDDAPTFTITSPNTSQTIFTNANGNVTINFTLNEANATRWNVTVDGTAITLTPSANNATNISIQNLSTGPHTIVFSAKDEAGNLATQVTRSITVVSQENVDTLMTTIKSSNTNYLRNVSLLNSTATVNGSIWMNQTLTLRFIANASVTDNYTVTMPSFNTSLANWNKTADLIVVTSKHSKQSNLSQNKSGTNITNLVLLQNTSDFLNDNYYNTSVIIFNQTLKDLNVLYIEDDQGFTIYNLTRCTGNTAPTSAVGTAATACYTNDSANVTAYVPHLSGVALANDTVAPTVNLTAPVNTTTPQTNSFVQVTADVWEANPRGAAFCSFNLTNMSGQVQAGTITLSNFTNTGVHYTHIHNYSNLINGTYNYTLNCSDIGLRNSATARVNFSILDTTVPTIETISTSSSGTGTATVTNIYTIVTSENANCAYSSSNVSYSSMTALAATGTEHSVSVSYTIDTTGTYYFRCIDKNGNVMDFSNSTSYTVDVTAASVASSTGADALVIPVKETIIGVESAKIWGSIKAGEEITMTVDKTEIPLTEVKIKVANDVSNIEVKVSELTQAPETEETLVISFKYLQLTAGHLKESDIEIASVTFKVTKEWISEQGINKEDVALKRFKDGKWNDLETEILSEDDTEITYKALTPGFSYFAIGVKEVIEEAKKEELRKAAEGVEEEEEPTEEPVEEPEEPPKSKAWLIILIILVVAVVAYLLYQQQTKKTKKK